MVSGLLFTVVPSLSGGYTRVNVSQVGIPGLMSQGGYTIGVLTSQERVYPRVGNSWVIPSGG